MSRLRIHFTDADIARTRIKLEIDLMWEVVSSAQILQHRDGALDFGAWRRRVHALAENDPDLRMALHTVVTVAPHADYFPDLLTQDVADIDEGIDAVLSVPSRRLRDEIDRILPAAGAAGSWLDDLANGRPKALRRLGDALRSYSRFAIEPHLPTIENGLRADTAAGIQQYLHGGAEGLLNWLAGVPGGGAPGPGRSSGAIGCATRWEPPVLSFAYPHDRDLYLESRGLVLIPCYFGLYHPVALADPRLRPVLAIPIRTESRLLAGGHADGDHASALLGLTRASILRSVIGGSTTTLLAKAVGVAPATVSHHTRVLRDAGLITTERHENFARHLITPLGLQLLAADR